MAVLRMIMFRPGGGDTHIKKLSQPSVQTSRLKSSPIQSPSASSISVSEPTDDEENKMADATGNAVLSNMTSQQTVVDAEKSRSTKTQIDPPPKIIPAEDGAVDTITSIQEVSKDWSAAVDAMNVTGLVKELAIHCAVQDISEDKIVLMLASCHESLLTEVSVKKLTEHIKLHSGDTTTLSIIVTKDEVNSPAHKLEKKAQQQLTQAQKNVEMNSFVQAIKRDFQAELVPGSIHSQSEQHKKERNK
jgi:DNA polymerase-3 subunit gamma/tau